MPKKPAPAPRPNALSRISRIALPLVALLLVFALVIAHLAQPRLEVTTIAPAFHGPVNAPISIQIRADRSTAVDAEARIGR